MALHKSIRLVGISLLLTTGICWLFALKLDDWLQSAATNYISKKTHYGVQIQSLHTDLKYGILELHGVKLTNPEGFPEPRFIHLNEVKIHIDWSSVLSNKIVFDEIVLDIDELAGVRNKQGATNIQNFADAFQGTSIKKDSKKESSKKAIASREFLIHRLFFRLGEITIADYKDGKEEVLSHHVGISRVFNNVSHYSQVLMPLVGDLSAFATTFIVDSLLKSTLDPKAYVDVVPKVLNPIKSNLEKAKNDTEKFLEKIFGDRKPQPAKATQK